MTLLGTKEIGPFGAVVDVDLRDAENVADDLRALFRQHGTLVFHDQDLTQAEQIAFVEVLGPVLNHFSMINYVSNRRADGYLRDSKLNFHSDASFFPVPALAICLHALEVEDAGETSTNLANGIAALEALPAALRQRIDGLSALHLFAVGEEAFADRQRLDDYPDNGPRAVHPLVMTDPMTGRETLFVPRVNTALIVGLPPAESEELLEELQSYLYKPENIYEHCWFRGDVLIWSNIGMHHARGRMGSGERTLQRVCSSAATTEMYDGLKVFDAGKR